MPVAPAAFAAHWGRLAVSAAAAAIAVTAAAGLGSLLGRLAFRRAPARDAAGFASRAFAGLAVAATAGLGLGLAGLLFPAVTIPVTLALAAAGLAAGPRLPRPRGPWRRTELAVAIAVVLLVAWTAFAVPPQTWVDTLGYHLGAPALWQRLHRVAATPESRFQYPLLFEHLVSLTGPLLDPAVLNLAALGLLTVLLAGWVARRFGRTAGWLAAAGWLASSQAAFLAAHVKHDLLATGYLLAAVVTWDLGGRGLACGAALGCALAVKYPSAAPGLAILAWEALRPGRRIRRVAWLAAGGAAAASPFLLKSWLLTGNPVFPLLFPGIGWGDAERQAFALLGCPGRDLDLADPEGLPRALVRLGTEMNPLAWVGLPLLALGAPAGTGKPLAAVAAGIAAWILFSPCFRFMVPAFPLAAALGAAGLAGFARGGPVRRRCAAAAAGAALLLGAVQGVASADFGRRAVAAALGLEPPDRYLARVLTTFREAARMSASLPAGGRILLVGESRGAPFNRNRTALSQDVSDEPLPARFARESPGARGIAIRFRQLGITSVVLNHVTSEYRGGITRQAFPWAPAALARYHEFWTRWAEVLPGPVAVDACNGGFAFYRIRLRPGPAVPAMSFLPGTEGLGLSIGDDGTAGTIRRLQAVLQFAPRVAQLQSRLWTALIGAGEFRTAEGWIRNGMSLGFRRADVYGSLGAALKGQGRLREAAAAFRQAAALDPAHPAYARLSAECPAPPGRKPAAER